MTPRPHRAALTDGPAPFSLPHAIDPQSTVRELAVKPGLTLASAITPLLRISDLERFLVCDRRTIERLRAAGKLPRPDILIGRSPRWRASTIQTWVERGGRP
jgi:predicted DNA-binding transcriptional regulator AlpA